MDLKVDIEKQDKKSTVTLNGEIDIYTAPDLKDQLLPLTKDKSTLEVDLSEVSYMDSTGLGVFISLLKSAKEHEGELYLLNPQSKVLRLFTITGLDQILNIEAPHRGEG